MKSGEYGCSVVLGIVEDPSDAVPPPFRGEVHPETAVGVADVLEEVDPIGAELPPDGREGIRHGHSEGSGARHAGIDRRDRRPRTSPARASIPPAIGGPRGPLKEPPWYPACYSSGPMAEYKQVLHERLYVRVPGHGQAPEDRRGPPEAPRRDGMARDRARPQARPHLGPVRAHRPCPDAGAAPQEGARDPDRAPAASGQPWRRVQGRPALADTLGPLTGYLPVNRAFDRTSFG